jgi:hypothetical protein
MNKNRMILMGLGAIISICILAAVFMPWVTVYTGTAKWHTEIGKASGWDITQRDISFKGIDLTQERSILPLFSFAGGIIALIPCVFGLFSSNRFLGIPLIVGGFLAMIGAIWALGDIFQANIYIEQSPDVMTITDGVINCLIASFSVLVIGIIRILWKQAPATRPATP